jgi:predicted MPP superfamily phosphohydrolase
VVSREIVTFGAYKVVFGQSVTNDFHQFRTLDRRKGEFSFVVFNDIHDQAATIPALLQVAGAQPYDFVLLNGDTIGHSDSEKPVVSILDQAAASFASSIPMFWVRGNHETRGAFARQLHAYIGLPGERYYYSFDHGPVHFVVLDTGEDKIDGHREYHGLVDFSRYRREESEWLKQHVREDVFRRAKYRVVICHMPFPSQAAADPAHYSEPNVFLGMAEDYELFGRTLESAGVDLMFSGHTHSAALIPPEPPRHSYPILQGGGNKGDGRTLIRVNVTRSSLEAVILRPDGSCVTSCRIAPHSSGWLRQRTH